MTFEHWTDGDSDSVFPKGDSWGHLGHFTGIPVKCCEIEGADWDDCMAKYHEHMGWEPYVRAPRPRAQ